jgi:hypothetical protein
VTFEQPMKFPMAGFNPTKPALVWDARTSVPLRWNPEWAEAFLRDYSFDEDGVVAWNGFLLDGWCHEPEIEQ